MKIYQIIFVCILSLTFARTATADLNNGLVAYYPFNGNTNDESGNANHGTENGGVSYVLGNIGQSASFDGINDYISVLDKNILDLPNISTISLWLKLSTKFDDPNNVLINKYRGDTASEDGYIIGVNQFSENEVFGWAKDSDGNVTNNAITASDHKVASISFDNWVHYSFVFENNSVTHYINGILYNTVNNKMINNSSGNDNPLIIGAGMSHTSQVYNFFSGLIDEVRIYNRVLSESEIQELYTQPNNKSVATGDLSQDIIGTWSFAHTTPAESMTFYTDGRFTQKKNNTIINGTYTAKTNTITFTPNINIVMWNSSTDEPISIENDTLTILNYPFTKSSNIIPPINETTVSDTLIITFPKLNYQGLYFSAVLDFKLNITTSCWELREITPLLGMQASINDVTVATDFMITIPKLKYQENYYSATLDYNGMCWTARDIEPVTPSNEPATSGSTTPTENKFSTIDHSGFDFSTNEHGTNSQDFYITAWPTSDFGSSYAWGSGVWISSASNELSYGAVSVLDQGNVDLASVTNIPSNSDFVLSSEEVDPPLQVNHVYLIKALDGYAKFKVISISPDPFSGDNLINDMKIEIEYVYTSGSSF